MIQYPVSAGFGVLTRVLDQGEGEGEQTIVCLHGVGARADRWRRNIPELAKAGYRVLALDMPGHGLATKNASLPYSVPFWSDAVLHVMDALDIQQAVICGTSLGGHVAADIACSSPERVSDVILVGTLGVVDMGAEARASLASAIVDRTRDGIRRKLATVVHDNRLITDEWADEEYRINNSPGAAEAFDSIAGYIRDRIDDDTVGERLNAAPERIRKLLVWGADDVLVPLSMGTASQKVLQDVRLVTLRGTGHAPYYERSNAFNDIVCDFLTDRLSDHPTQER